MMRGLAYTVTVTLARILLLSAGFRSVIATVPPRQPVMTWVSRGSGGVTTVRPELLEEQFNASAVLLVSMVGVCPRFFHPAVIVVVWPTINSFGDASIQPEGRGPGLGPEPPPGVGVGPPTTILTLANALPRCISRTVDDPGAQPYTVRVAVVGIVLRPPLVPLHRALRHSTFVSVMSELTSIPSGLHSARMLADPPTRIVVSDALTEPVGRGVGVLVGRVSGVGVSVGSTTGGSGVSVAVGLGSGVSVGVSVGGTGVGVLVGGTVSSQTNSNMSGSHSQPLPKPFSDCPAIMGADHREHHEDRQADYEREMVIQKLPEAAHGTISLVGSSVCLR